MPECDRFGFPCHKAATGSDFWGLTSAGIVCCVFICPNNGMVAKLMLGVSRAHCLNAGTARCRNCKRTLGD